MSEDFEAEVRASYEEDARSKVVRDLEALMAKLGYSPISPIRIQVSHRSNECIATARCRALKS